MCNCSQNYKLSLRLWNSHSNCHFLALVSPFLCSASPGSPVVPGNRPIISKTKMNKAKPILAMLTECDSKFKMLRCKPSYDMIARHLTVSPKGQQVLKSFKDKI